MQPNLPSFDIAGVDNIRWKSFFSNEDYQV